MKPRLPTVISRATQYLPSLDDEFVAALRSLPDLRLLDIQVGRGSLLPQIGSLSQHLLWLKIRSICMRGPIPVNLIANMKNWKCFEWIL